MVRENPNPLGKLRAMVESRAVTAALFELGSLSAAIAQAAGLIETLDWAAANPEPMFEEARLPYGFRLPVLFHHHGLAVGCEALTSWADFWNVRDFPGKRTLPDNVNARGADRAARRWRRAGAALSAGSSPRFRKLDQIKGNVAVWWGAGAQPPQL